VAKHFTDQMPLQTSNQQNNEGKSKHRQQPWEYHPLAYNPFFIHYWTSEEKVLLPLSQLTDSSTNQSTD